VKSLSLSNVFQQDASHSSNPNAVYHIHVDAQHLAPDFETFLLESLGFFLSHFAGHPEDALHFEAPRHLTCKTNDSKVFLEVFEQAKAFAEANPSSFVGYIEGECIPLDLDLLDRPFDPSIEFPFKFELAPLSPGKFREDEIHITLDRDKSDPRLLQVLRSAGFFSAYMEKPNNVVEILTVQGTYRQIQELLPDILKYLNAAGGSVSCSVKEERIIKWWLSQPDVPVPPTISAVIACHQESKELLAV
jgi:hypothetical protein